MKDPTHHRTKFVRKVLQSIEPLPEEEKEVCEEQSHQRSGTEVSDIEIEEQMLVRRPLPLRYKEKQRMDRAHIQDQKHR